MSLVQKVRIKQASEAPNLDDPDLTPAPSCVSPYGHQCPLSSFFVTQAPQTTGPHDVPPPLPGATDPITTLRASFQEMSASLYALSPSRAHMMDFTISSMPHRSADHPDQAETLL